MQVAPAGDNAVLIDLGDVTAAELHSAAAAVRAQSGVVACIVGHSSLYVVAESSSLPVFEELNHSATRRLDDSATRTIRVFFDGPDLAEFLALANLTREQFLANIPSLTVRYLGFRGGFGYLDGWPEEWSMPRRPTSRPVARGSFAIAGNVAGFYPIDTPGGWNVLGRTDEDLKHALTPGEVITIEPASSVPSPRSRGEGKGEGLRIDGVEIIQAPLARLIHPRNWSNIERGIPEGGPFDDIAAALVMKAVIDCEALLECAMTGPRLRFRKKAVAAWCGPDLDVRLVQGQELAIGRITGGLRGYLAIGRESGVIAHVERDDRHVIRAMRGPHDVGIEEVECEVTPSLDRVGVRLRPLRALNVDIPADLRSVGMQCGTVQVHPDGSLVAMGPDHPITGGYLQPMTVITTERWKLGQLMPGERVTFRSSASAVRDIDG